MKTIAERLKFARIEKGWTQSQLAVAADVSTGTIGNIESEARQAKGSLPQIAEALGVRHKWLYQGIGPMKAALEETTTYLLDSSAKASNREVLHRLQRQIATPHTPPRPPFGGFFSPEQKFFTTIVINLLAFTHIRDKVTPIAANKTPAKRSKAVWLAVLEVSRHLKPGTDDGMNTRPSNHVAVKSE
jgi:transcriptional regulator with XRE-family HTH domain